MTPACILDDAGPPDTAFRVGHFWSMDAPSQAGRVRRAREGFEDAASHRDAFGLPSGDLDAAAGEPRDRRPRTCPMAGMIDSAMGLSQSWEGAW